jgi:hypothetical protein
VLVLALLLCGVAAGAPAPAVELRAASFDGKATAEHRVPAASHLVADRTPLDVQLGDGIFRLRIRGCEDCPASLTIEMRLGELWQLISSVNHLGLGA